jgi:phage/plasmid-associated DNA primase
VRGGAVVSCPALLLVRESTLIPGPQPERTPTAKVFKAFQTNIAEGILGACLAWQTGGLQVPERVRSYTEEYRTEVDPLTDFFEECVIIGKSGRVERSRLFETHRVWAHRAGEQPLTPKAFANALKRRGVTDGGKSGSTRYWQGISLLERPADVTAHNDPF